MGLDNILVNFSQKASGRPANHLIVSNSHFRRNGEKWPDIKIGLDFFLLWTDTLELLEQSDQIGRYFAYRAIVFFRQIVFIYRTFLNNFYLNTKVVHYLWQKRFGLHFGQVFFTNSSGHPVLEPRHDWMAHSVKTRSTICIKFLFLLIEAQPKNALVNPPPKKWKWMQALARASNLHFFGHFFTYSFTYSCRIFLQFYNCSRLLQFYNFQATLNHTANACSCFYKKLSYFNF
jgi:hypothetical protein